MVAIVDSVCLVVNACADEYVGGYCDYTRCTEACTRLCVVASTNTLQAAGCACIIPGKSVCALNRKVERSQ